MFLYRYIYPPENGVIRIVSMEGLYGLLDLEMNVIVDPKFDGMGMPSSNLVPVKKDGLWGFLKIDGDMLLSPQFEDASYFREGRAAVKKNGSWGFISNKGAMVIDPIYPDVNIFSEGLCAVLVKNVKKMFTRKRANTGGTQLYEPPEKVKGHRKGWGYIDKFGEFVISPWFYHAGIFKSGLAIVKKSRNSAPVFINKKGEIVLSGGNNE